MTLHLLALLLLPAALVPQLGHRSFRQRERAGAALTRLGDWARPAVEAAASHPDPEVRGRAAQLQRPEWVDEVAEAKSRRILPRNYPRLPWLYLTDAGMGHYLSLARQEGGKTGPPDWPEYREATRLWALAQFQQRRPRRDILDDLDRMATEEVGFIRSHGGNYLPPLVLPAGVK